MPVRRNKAAVRLKMVRSINYKMVHLVDWQDWWWRAIVWKWNSEIIVFNIPHSIGDPTNVSLYPATKAFIGSWTSSSTFCSKWMNKYGLLCPLHNNAVNDSLLPSSPHLSQSYPSLSSSLTLCYVPCDRFKRVQLIHVSSLSSLIGRFRLQKNPFHQPRTPFQLHYNLNFLLASDIIWVWS